MSLRMEKKKGISIVVVSYSSLEESINRRDFLDTYELDLKLNGIPYNWGPKPYLYSLKHKAGPTELASTNPTWKPSIVRTN